MAASDLPLDILQRIETRWSAQLKSHQQQHDFEARAASPSSSDDPDDRALVDIAEWEKPRAGDR